MLHVIEKVGALSRVETSAHVLRSGFRLLRGKGVLDTFLGEAGARTVLNTKWRGFGTFCANFGDFTGRSGSKRHKNSFGYMLPKFSKKISTFFPKKSSKICPLNRPENGLRKFYLSGGRGSVTQYRKLVALRPKIWI